MMNEHICGVAIYYLDRENVTSSNLSFRMQTPVLISRKQTGGAKEDEWWMEQVYGTKLVRSAGPCLQNYGTIETIPGRLVAFPNVL